MQLTANQQLWVDALRSGDYEQGAGQLQRGEAFCCLGVACKVAEKHGVDIACTDVGLRGVSLYSQPAVMSWLGAADGYGVLPGTSSLSVINDAGGRFIDIADLIEKHANELFT